MHFAETQAAMFTLAHLLLSGVDFSSADLSTPRGALTHYRDLIYAASNREGKQWVVMMFDTLFKGMDSGQYSPEQVEKLHFAAREACTTVHSVVGLFKVSWDWDEDLVIHATNVQRAIIAGASSIKQTIKYGQEVANTKQTKDILEAVDQKGGDSYEIVD